MKDKQNFSCPRWGGSKQFLGGLDSRIGSTGGRLGPGGKPPWWPGPGEIGPDAKDKKDSSGVGGGTGDPRGRVLLDRDGRERGWRRKWQGVYKAENN